MARYDFRGKRAFRAFVTVPFVLPTVVVATAFLVLFRPGGALSFLGWQRGLGPLLVAEVFFNVAVIVRTVGGFWAQPRPPPHRRGPGARRVARRGRSARSRCRCSGPRSRRPRRSCSCSRSPRSAWCCCSPTRRTRRWKSRSTARRSSSSTFRRRPRSRSCRSSPSCRCSWCWRACRSDGRSPNGSWRRATRRAGPGAGNGWSWSACSAPRPCSSAARSSCWRSSRCAWAGAGRSSRTGR